VPDKKSAKHWRPQAIPGGVLVTVPLPDLLTVNLKGVEPPSTHMSTQKLLSSSTPFAWTLYVVT
jgi:hypothetical protein